jgi:hypothetical protein
VLGLKKARREFVKYSKFDRLALKTEEKTEGVETSEFATAMPFCMQITY